MKLNYGNDSPSSTTTSTLPFNISPPPPLSNFIYSMMPCNFGFTLFGISHPFYAYMNLYEFNSTSVWYESGTERAVRKELGTDWAPVRKERYGKSGTEGAVRKERYGTSTYPLVEVWMPCSSKIYPSPSQ
jgi:hypothetical protein